MKHWFILTFLILGAFRSLGQRTFFIKDKLTNEVIPFVKIYPDNDNPFLADIDGVFTVSEPVSSVVFSC
jgi:hypothetical protein